MGMFNTARFGGILLDPDNGRIVYPNGRLTFKPSQNAILGAHAEYGYSNDRGERITATRLALGGPLALAFKKDRGVNIFVVIEFADGTSTYAEKHVTGKDRTKVDREARQFVWKINDAARQAALAAEAATTTEIEE